MFKSATQTVGDSFTSGFPVSASRDSRIPFERQAWEIAADRKRAGRRQPKGLERGRGRT